MKIGKISDNFYEEGILINSTKSNEINSLNKKKIKKIFFDKGIIVFRNFNLSVNNFSKFADQFTKRYANDAVRRKIKHNNKKILSVDLGNNGVKIHSEASFSPSWPEIIWFYCSKPPIESGFTTAADGIKIYNNLCLETKKFFLKNQIVYKLLIPYKRNYIQKKVKINKKKNSILKEWVLPFPGTFDTKINLNESYIETKFARYAVNVTKKLNMLSFCNHLQPALTKDEPQIIDCRLFNGDKIPKSIIEEITRVSKSLTYEIKWQKNDFCMIDNRRFMHGRTKILKNEKRDISIIQTLVSDFDS